MRGGNDFKSIGSRLNAAGFGSTTYTATLVQ